MQIPSVKYYSRPEKQNLHDKICNEIQVSFDESETLLTPEEITKNINDRLGDSYTVDQVKGVIGNLGATLTLWNNYMVIYEMVSEVMTDYRAHLSKSKKWKNKWK